MKRTIVNIELSLGEREMLVWDAYFSNMDLPGYVWRITNTEVIASQAGKLWIIPYELGEDNTIVFGDPAEADIVPVTNNLLKTVQALPGKVINAIKKELGMNKKEKLIGQLLKTNAGFTKEQLEGMEESLLESMAKLATAEGTSEEQLEETPAPEQPVPLAEKPPEWFTQWSTSFEQRFGAVEEAVQGNAKEARQKLIDHIVANSEMTAEDLKDVPDSTLAKMAKPLAPVDFGLRRWPQAGAFNANDYAEAPMPAPATNGAQGGK